MSTAAAGAAVSSESGPIAQSITSKLQSTFSPIHLSVINESYMHAVPRGSETHFKVTVVSNLFNSLPLIQRHRAVNTCLAHELANGVHALSITARTPTQWEQDQTVHKSPACMGGSKHDIQRNNTDTHS
jgi:stress-induced morphogen